MSKVIIAVLYHLVYLEQLSVCKLLQYNVLLVLILVEPPLNYIQMFIADKISNGGKILELLLTFSLS